MKSIHLFLIAGGRKKATPRLQMPQSKSRHTLKFCPVPAMQFELCSHWILIRGNAQPCAWHFVL